MSDHLSQ
ncbi:hypothetical protein YPPY03_2014, partial [Yersinia pestis PY-03]